jgi:hypothetical protein
MIRDFRAVIVLSALPMPLQQRSRLFQQPLPKRASRPNNHPRGNVDCRLSCPGTSASPQRFASSSRIRLSKSSSSARRSVTVSARSSAARPRPTLNQRARSRFRTSPGRLLQRSSRQPRPLWSRQPRPHRIQMHIIQQRREIARLFGIDQTPSLPDACSRSNRFRCGGRESKFLADESKFLADIRETEGQSTVSISAGGFVPRAGQWQKNGDL